MSVPFITGVLDTSDTSGSIGYTVQDQIKVLVANQNIQTFMAEKQSADSGQSLDQIAIDEAVAEAATYAQEQSIVAAEEVQQNTTV